MGMMAPKEGPAPSEGICYGCRHVGDGRFSDPRLGHCKGTGHLPSAPEDRWPGFICTCFCVSVENLDKAIDGL